jgi:hypothetical protein
MTELCSGQALGDADADNDNDADTDTDTDADTPDAADKSNPYMSPFKATQKGNMTYLYNRSMRNNMCYSCI